VRWTVIARAAAESGAGIEARYPNLTQEDAENLVRQMSDAIATNFEEMFGMEPTAHSSVMLPYVAQVDEQQVEV